MPIDGMLTRALEESKTDVITKIDVIISRILIVLTIGEITGTSKDEVDKIVELDDVLTIDVLDSGAKEEEG